MGKEKAIYIAKPTGKIVVDIFCVLMIIWRGTIFLFEIWDSIKEHTLENVNLKSFIITVFFILMIYAFWKANRNRIELYEEYCIINKKKFAYEEITSIQGKEILVKRGMTRQREIVVEITNQSGEISSMWVGAIRNDKVGEAVEIIKEKSNLT